MTKSNFQTLGATFLAVTAMWLTALTGPARADWGAALSFDGVDDYVFVDPGVALSNTSFSVEFRAQQREFGREQQFVSQGSNHTHQALLLGFVADGRALFTFYDFNLFSTNAYTDGGWHHWAFTYDASSRARTILRDGTVVGADIAPANYQGAGKLYIGRRFPPLYNQYLSGSLQEVRVWNTARSPAEILANKDQSLTGTEPSLVAYWPLNEGMGTIAYDATPNHHNGTLVNGPSFVAPETSGVDFGLAVQYDTGVNTCVAINDAGLVVEMHESEGASTLYDHVGHATNGTVFWGGSVNAGGGGSPSITINDSNKVVEVHETDCVDPTGIFCNNDTCWYRVGTVSDNTITWQPSVEYTTGLTPSVALNNQGVVVHVAKAFSGNALNYKVGQLGVNHISWAGAVTYDSGRNPSIALNDQGDVVEVHRASSGDNLDHRVGKVNGSSITWGPSTYYDTGVDPSVALRDDGYVTEVHESEAWIGLWRRIGVLNGDRISWIGSSVNFDNGADPSVACNSKLAIQTHKGETFYGLWYSTSLITDRASWMEDRLYALGDRTLKQLVMPGSHDAAMYFSELLNIGKTQELTIYDQLCHGIRYFDLRPEWDSGVINIHHSGLNGPALSTVLDDVGRFMADGHRELVILKFSHYQGFDDSKYVTLVNQITNALGSWLYSSNSLPAGKRLADVTLAEFVPYQGTVLVVCDLNYPVNNPADGIWVYRGSPGTGATNELSVFDQYSNTASYDTMRSDQTQKFNNFSGSADLFLLSWTCTQQGDPSGWDTVWNLSQDPNRNLAREMTALQIPNAQGFLPNVLYVDYVEHARVCDVALYVNNCPDVGEELITAPGLELSSLQDHIELSLRSVVNRPVQIEQATDLVNPVWTPIHAVIVTNVPHVFNLSVPAEPVAFYRAVVGP